METRLQQVLNGKEENYILPFFWQHGEAAEQLREYMGAIYASGIRAVCVESRPHPDYVGPKWWRDMDVIMEEARRLGMKVWVLDDAHFPTGYCNGQIKSHPEYGKRYLDHYTIDVPGPEPEAAFLLQLKEGEELVGVIAAKRSGRAVGELCEAIDITEQVQDGLVYFAVPEGYWNIIVLKSTSHSSSRKDYCNLLDAEAVRFFLDTVYEPHWEHYREDFGETFAGFFSDEPELGNTFGEYPDMGIGQPNMVLPWSRELSEWAQKLWGDGRCIHLAALWSHIEGVWEKARYEYMNMVTDLYGRNFCTQIGDWCRERGVEYIGHVVEDNGNHARTGYGTGHFYKALWGQHMSGVDVVLQQLRPGYDDRDFYHIGGKNTYDGRFFHYGLARMGSSLGHLDPGKRGRTFCELYGAYGWTEGLKLMKWIADHMLVRGVNWFVPHAFSPADFPDADCPPHFYARGRNPQYPWFAELMRYLNRMAHLLNGGAHMADAAVLYTAESSWMGEYEPFETVGRMLTENQIDHDVVPVGLLENGVFTFLEGRCCLQINGECFSVLIVPVVKKIPKELAVWLQKAETAGFPVLFMGAEPEVIHSQWEQRSYFALEEAASEDSMKAADRRACTEEVARSACADTTGEVCADTAGEGSRNACVRELLTEAALLSALRSIFIPDIALTEKHPGLRTYHYRQEEEDYYLFFQEGIREQTRDWLTLREEGAYPEGACAEAQGTEQTEYFWYDGWENKVSPAKRDAKGRLQLVLEPYETKVLVIRRAKGGDRSVEEQSVGEPYILELAGPWRFAKKRYDEDAFEEAQRLEGLFNVTGPQGSPDFSGQMRYEINFVWDTQKHGSRALLYCGRVYETLEVWLNGSRQGVRITPPYCVRLEGLVQGENRLTLIAANTLVHSVRDDFSVTMPVEPSGVLGPVRIEKL